MIKEQLEMTGYLVCHLSESELSKLLSRMHLYTLWTPLPPSQPFLSSIKNQTINHKKQSNEKLFTSYLLIQLSRFLFKHFTVSKTFLQRREKRILVVVKFVVVVMFLVVESRDVKEMLHSGAEALPGLHAVVVTWSQVPWHEALGHSCICEGKIRDQRRRNCC